jgi:hypothetical protein
MHKLIDEFYDKFKVAALITMLAVTIIGFLWKFLADLLPFIVSTKTDLLWSLKVILSLTVIVMSLAAYIIYLRRKMNSDRISPVDLNKYR